MTTIHEKSSHPRRGDGPRFGSHTSRHSRVLRAGAVALVVGATSSLGACDSLLAVTLPGSVTAESLDDPRMARTVVLGARADFECAFAAYVMSSGVLTDEFISSSTQGVFNQWDVRGNITNAQGCYTSSTANSIGYYGALQRGRYQAEDAYRRVSEASVDVLPDKSTLLAQSALAAGYSYTLLGESFCVMAIDTGPALQPDSVLRIARTRFTTAIADATAANDQQILNAARVGRARVNLDLGDRAAALADANLVPAGFAYMVEYSTADPRTENQVYNNDHRKEYISVDPFFRDLEVDGVADPRVPVLDAERMGADRLTPLWFQQKYPTASSPIRLAGWPEAQLIAAEIELGQAAVDRINVLRDHHGLPNYAPTNVGDDAEVLAQVIEERRRELFAEGHRYNDILRLGIEWQSGRNHKNLAYGATTCMPLPDVEYRANPNL